MQVVDPFYRQTLCQLLGFVVERIHHFAHVLNGLQRCLVGLVHHRLVKDDQHTLALVQDTCRDGAGEGPSQDKADENAGD